MENSVLILFGAIVAVGILLLLVITLTRGRRRPLNQTYYRERIQSIEAQTRGDDMNALHMAVLNADKLFDNALKERGYKGDTMGERLKRATRQLNNANAIWAAHKLRNRIAHEDKVNVSRGQALKAVAIFKAALKDLGAL
jgi:hypothetical protein